MPLTSVSPTCSKEPACCASARPAAATASIACARTIEWKRKERAREIGARKSCYSRARQEGTRSTSHPRSVYESSVAERRPQLAGAAASLRERCSHAGARSRRSGFTMRASTSAGTAGAAHSNITTREACTGKYWRRVHYPQSSRTNIARLAHIEIRAYKWDRERGHGRPCIFGYKRGTGKQCTPPRSPTSNIAYIAHI
jgi:hypothetical protein